MIKANDNKKGLIVARGESGLSSPVLRLSSPALEHVGCKPKFSGLELLGIRPSFAELDSPLT